MTLWSTYVLPTLVEKACRSHAILEERRRWIPQATGHVLEVGVGSGLNLPFFDAARATSVVGLDSSAPLLRMAQPRADRAAVPVQLVEGDAERMRFDRGRFDTVVLTYTLCSVPSPARTLAEIKRVLRAEGSLIFIEHGRSPDPRAYRVQRLLTPAWRRVGGNCHLDRDIAHELTGAGFAGPDIHAAITADQPSFLSFKLQGVARPVE